MSCLKLSVLEKSRKFIDSGVQEVEVTDFLKAHNFFIIEKASIRAKEAYPFNYRAEGMVDGDYIIQVSDFDIKVKKVKSDGSLVDIDNKDLVSDWRALMAEKFEDYVPALEMYLKKREEVSTKSKENSEIVF